MPYALPAARPVAAPADTPALLVIPPRALMADELRLARLEAYLAARFPDLTVLVSDDRRLARTRPAVGLRRRAGGPHPLVAPETASLVDDVLAAVELFLEYGVRAH